MGSTHLRSDTGFGASMPHSPNFTSKPDQGDMGVKKLLRVCEKCNSGWISAIENQIKDTVGSLVLGEAVSLNDENIPKISTWIAIMAILAEFMTPDERAIHRHHRNYIFKHLEPDPGFQIWLGKYNGQFPQLYRWAHTIYSDKPQDVNAPTFSVLDHPDHCQVTIIVLGRLLIVCATNPDSDIERMFAAGLQFYKTHLVQIWPRQSEPSILSQWPTRSICNDYDLDSISHIMPGIIRVCKAMAIRVSTTGRVR